MSKKIIKTTLDAKELGRAIKELQTFKKDFIAKTKTFMSQLVDAGVEIARNEVIELGAFDSGELANSIQGTVMYTDGKNKGIIFTNCPWAAFVELGTGIVGAESPHPTKPWEYDTGNHGDAGWVYFDESRNRFFWTKGMPSRPFLYHTALELERRIPEIAREVWG